MIKPSYRPSRLISRLSRRSRLAANKSCISSAHLVKCILRSRATTSSWASAVRRWLFPDPGFPKTKTFSFRSRKLPSSSVRNCRIAFAGNRFEIESLQRLLQRQRRVFQQPLHPALPPLLAFPRDHFQQILLIAQRLSFCPPRRVFVALPHRRQVQILELLNQRRADVS